MSRSSSPFPVVGHDCFPEPFHLLVSGHVRRKVYAHDLVHVDAASRVPWRAAGGGHSVGTAERSCGNGDHAPAPPRVRAPCGHLFSSEESLHIRASRLSLLVPYRDPPSSPLELHPYGLVFTTKCFIFPSGLTQENAPREFEQRRFREPQRINLPRRATFLGLRRRYCEGLFNQPILEVLREQLLWPPRIEKGVGTT